ncbi:hypothetical protein BJV78DRAFT_1225301 [Lactifluus subvellereus]|nr:hypothetical protein BJV78DRAFT_1225301 [Lactifluus subvellereus]
MPPPPRLFSGTACFSPSVPSRLLSAWGKRAYIALSRDICCTGYPNPSESHGGTVACTYEERRAAKYYFCSGAGDPWIAGISAQGLIVFDAAWIAHCVRETFRVAIAPYVLDGADAVSTVSVEPDAPRKVHCKRRASSVRLSTTTSPSLSPAARAPPPRRSPKRARLNHLSLDRGATPVGTKESAKSDIKREDDDDDEISQGCALHRNRAAPVPHVDLAAKWRAYRSLAVKRHVSTQTGDGARYTRFLPTLRPLLDSSFTIWRKDAGRMDAGPDFLRTVYSAKGQTRFKVDAVLSSLKGLSVVGTRVFKCGERHLGEEFRLASARTRSEKL